MKNIFFGLLLFSINLFAQTYISDDGTSAEKWRIGNDRYIQLYSDDDSNFVQVNINGYDTRLATQDWILSKTRADSVRHAYNLMGGAANKIPYQIATDSTAFIDAPTSQKFLYYNNGWQWKWAWSPDSTTVVRTTRLITTTAPIRIDGSSSAYLSADRTLSLLYNTTNLQISSNYLNTIQDIATTSSPTFAQLTLSNAATTTTNAVRADRTITTSDPLRIAGTTSANLIADRTLSMLYNSTNLKITSSALNTIQDIATTSSPTFVDQTLTGRLDQQGTTNSEFGSNYILPKQNYYGNLGAINKKYLTLHAAELWVETLVAQNTIATIGGRILVGPTTQLVSDFSSSATTVYVKYNNLSSGDIVYMEADGKVEFMQVTSSYSGSSGNYSYTVTRNLDGTGANQWYAGDAVFNTGTTGDGFIDLYSVRGVKSSSQYGPTIVGDVRNSATYNDWSEHWAIGNLNGLYGYTSDTYGVGLGKYANSSSYITIDNSNGIRLRYKNSSGTITDKITLDMSGNATFTGTITATSSSNVILTGGAATDINNGSTTITGGKITTGTVTLSQLNFTPVQTSNVVASINASAEGLTINGSKLTINSSTTFASGYDPTTKITAGGAASDINNNTTTINGGKITTNTVTLSQLSFTPVQSSNVVAMINASTEGLDISADRVSISGSTTFASGYDPTGKISTGGAAGDINNNTTTINGGKITTSTITADKLSVTDLYSIGATIGGWTIASAGISKQIYSGTYTEYLQINTTSGNEAIYFNTGGTVPTGALRWLGIGTLYNGSAWTTEKGIGMVRCTASSTYQKYFWLSDASSSIAGIDFDYQRLYSISSSTGFEISKASSKNVTTGFAVWDIASSPKMFIGNSTSSMDWNSTTSNTLTIKGDVKSSKFSTISSFDTTSTNYVIIQDDYMYQQSNKGTYGIYSPASIYFSSGNYYTTLQVSSTNGSLLNMMGDKASILISSRNVPKFYGVTSSPSATNRNAGDMYMGTNNIVWMWNGSSWIQLN